MTKLWILIVTLSVPSFAGMDCMLFLDQLRKAPKEVRYLCREGCIKLYRDALEQFLKEHPDKLSDTGAFDSISKPLLNKCFVACDRRYPAPKDLP